MQGGNQIAGQEKYTIGSVSSGVSPNLHNNMSSSHYQTTGV